jgi:multiple sugar transport system substrate-binding protein
MTISRSRAFLLLFSLAASACEPKPGRVLTFSGSAVGREGDVIRRQLDRFHHANPSIAVALRVTPDAADQRHQLYVQWLNAHASEPDVLQLDVAWIAEFAAAGWTSHLDGFQPPVDRFFSPAVAAGRWNGALYALPWFIDVGMLYWRTDLAANAPTDLGALVRLSKRAQQEQRVPFGLVWQGARYEGLVTVFVEFLGAFGGSILDGRGQVAVDSDAARKALTFMRDAVYVDGIVPPAVLTWQEEQTRFAFQNGEAMFMRNWPYAYTLLQDRAQSQVAGKFAVASMPAAPGGKPTAALGGAALAINAYSDRPADAYRLIEFLLQPDQMIERARIVGQYPPRRELYESGALDGALEVPPVEALRIIEGAVPRPVTPVYTQLSEILQVSLHRALTRQQEPRAALDEAAAAMRTLLARVRLSPGCHEEHGSC